MRTPAAALLLLAALLWACDAPVPGCADRLALNYDAKVNISNGSCVYQLGSVVWSGTRTQLKPFTWGGLIPEHAYPYHPDSAWYDVVSNTQAAQGLGPGQLYMLRVYRLLPSGLPDTTLASVYAFYKREAGFYPEFYDFEALRSAPGISQVSSTSPNGPLPSPNNYAQRGRLAECKNCHQQAPGSDGLFVR